MSELCCHDVPLRDQLPCACEPEAESATEQDVSDVAGPVGLTETRNVGRRGEGANNAVCSFELMYI